MSNVTVSYFKINKKVQRNKIQSTSERADQSRSDQAHQIMSGKIRVEHIRDGEIRSEQMELRGMIRLEQGGVKASGEKNWHIGAEQEHHGEREEPCQKRKNKAFTQTYNF